MNYLRQYMRAAHDQQKAEEWRRQDAKLVIFDPDFIRPELKAIDPADAYSLWEMLAWSAGLNFKPGQFEDEDDVRVLAITASEEGASQQRERLHMVLTRYARFLGLQKFDRTPRVEDGRDGPFVIAADFMAWAGEQGWVLPAKLANAQSEEARIVNRGDTEEIEGCLQRVGKRTDNLTRAILAAWRAGLSNKAQAPEVLDYLAEKDDTGYIRRRDGDSIEWITTSGSTKTTSLKTLYGRLTRLRGLIDNAD